MSNSRFCEKTLHQTATRLAVRCRRIVQACLREEEWGDADREFYHVIRNGLERYRLRVGKQPAGQAAEDLPKAGREANDRKREANALPVAENST